MLLGYLVVRIDPDPDVPWKGSRTPGLPLALLVSTVALIASSVTHHRALAAARATGGVAVWRWMAVTCGLAAIFLVTQGLAWVQMWQGLPVAPPDLPPEPGDPLLPDLFSWTFFVLTGLHAAHVVGGCVGLGLVTAHAHASRYGPGRSNGVLLSAMYWHSLDAIWIVTYLTLWLGAR
jgi:cytochrome c oxidase subunit 3